jgi:hypothetical protein
MNTNPEIQQKPNQVNEEKTFLPSLRSPSFPSVKKFSGLLPIIGFVSIRVHSWFNP